MVEMLEIPRDTIPTKDAPQGAERPLRIAAVGDIHCGKSSAGRIGTMFESVHDHADVLVLCGDLTDYGTPEETLVLARDLAAIRVPVIAVLGNHDYETGQADAVRSILAEHGVQVLDGESCEVGGVGFAGVKGFAGGFGRGTLGFWGEGATKKFVQEAIDEALKLESALAHLTTERKVAVLHYSPIQATVVGELPEIFPFLGCSRLEEPLTRYPVVAVLHGHAHKGTPEGRTVNDTPVYNVALPVLMRAHPDRPPYRVVVV